MTVIDAAHRFGRNREIDPGCPYSFVIDRSLDVEITLQRSGERALLTDLPAHIGRHAVALMLGAARYAPASTYCWGAHWDETDQRAAMLFYDPEYIACFRGLDQPPDSVEFTSGAERFHVTFVAWPTPDACVGVAFA